MKKLLTLLMLLAGAAQAAVYQYNGDVTTIRGDAIGAAMVKVYKAGTDSLATLYSTAALGYSGNPVYTDSYGRYRFYAAPGRYDITISGVNVVTYTIEDIYIAGDETSYQFNVKNFGAVGDGVTDDTAAIQAAADSMKSYAHYSEVTQTSPIAALKSAELYFPPGDYLITDPIFLGTAGQVWPDTANYDKAANKVSGFGASIIAQTGGEPALDLTGAMNMEIRGLTIIGSTTNSPNIGLLMSRGGTVTPHNASAGNHRFFQVTTAGNFTLAAVYNYGSEVNKWEQCYLTNFAGKATIYMTSNNVRQYVQSTVATIDSTYQSSYGGTFNNCTISWYGATAPRDTCSGNIVIESMSFGPKFTNCFINALTSAVDSIASPAIRVKPASGLGAATAGITQGLSVTGCTFESGFACAIMAEGKLVNPVFKDNSGGMGSFPFGDIFIIDSANAGIYAYDFQRDQGSTNVNPLEWTVGANGVRDLRWTTLTSADDLDDYMYPGEWGWNTDIPTNAPQVSYGYLDVKQTAACATQFVRSGFDGVSLFGRWYNRVTDTWSGWQTLSSGITPQMFGAVADGTADDTDAIQSAINYAHTSGVERVYIPAGIYKTTRTLTVGSKYAAWSWYMHIEGDGRGTIIWCSTDTMSVGLWFKSTMITTGVGSRPGYGNRLERLTMVGPNAVAGGTPAYIGIQSQPTDTLTLLKTGGHTIDGDSASFSCDFSASDINLWAANIGWEMYYTHYGTSNNIGFEWNNNAMVINGSHSARLTHINSRFAYDTGLDIKASDGLYLGNITMQTQHGVEAVRFYGAMRGATMENPYFEACDSVIFSVVGTGAETGPSLRVVGGINVSGDTPDEIWNQGADLVVDGFRDPYSIAPSTGGTTIVATTGTGRRSRTQIGPTSMVSLEADSAQWYSRPLLDGPPVQTGKLIVDGGNFSGAIGVTTNIPTDRRGGGTFTVTRRISDSNASQKTMGVFVSEVGNIDTTYIGGAVAGLTFTDDGGFIKITMDAGGGCYVVNWSFFDSLTP